MYTRKQLQIAAYGGIGGILPNLLDLALQLDNRDLGKWFDETTSVFFALLGPGLAYLIYFGIGGVIAMAFEETKPLKALVLGVSAPALIVAWLSGDAPKDDPAQLSEFLGVKTAYAAEPQHFRRMVDPDFEGDFAAPYPPEDWGTAFIVPDNPWGHGLKYKLLDQFGEEHASGTFSGPGKTRLKVPVDWSIFFFGYGINPKMLASPQENETYQIDLERNYWNDFYRALGVRYKEPYDLKLRRMDNGT